MYRIIDDRGSGKTSRLLLLAKENNKPVVCANPYAMKQKAMAYGIVGIEFVSYYEALNNVSGILDDGCFIDELSTFAHYALGCKTIHGYTESKDD